MPLTIRLKPDEKVIIGGAVIRNGNHAAELYVENLVPILRRKDIMSEAEAITPARQIYFEVQLVYIDSERREIHLEALQVKAKSFLGLSIPETTPLVEKICTLVSANDCYHALKVAKELISLEDSFIASTTS
jgi:flagellar protein FlbT